MVVTGRKAGFWLWTGLLLVGVNFALLELMQPFYFCQDDNFAQFLPVILEGCRSLFEDGKLSTINPYNWLGTPTASLGTYSLTYPPTYASYFVAKDILGNRYLFMEVFALFHLVLGYVATYWLCRSIRMRPFLACLGALLFIFSGYFLIAGRSWYYMLPVMLWLPLYQMLIVKLVERKGGWLWLLGAALVIGGSFHAGNAQNWVYFNLFFVLAALTFLWCGELPTRSLLWVGSALLVGTGLAMPLLVPQYMLLMDVSRSPWGNGISKGILAMLLPYPFAQAEHPNGWGNTYRHLTGHIYYSGTLFVAVCFFVYARFCYRLGKLDLSSATFRQGLGKVGRVIADFARTHPWLILGLVAFLLALGDRGLLWDLMSRLPVFEKFSNPFKLLPFVNLFFVLGGGVALEGFFSAQRDSKRLALWGGAALGLLFYHVMMAKTSFCTYEERPYPRLESSIVQRLAADQGSEPVRRMVPLAPWRDFEEGYVRTLTHNFSAVYSVMALGGYDDGLASQLPAVRDMLGRFYADPLEASARYGVRWLLYSGEGWYAMGKERFAREFLQQVVAEKADAGVSIPPAEENSIELIEMPYPPDPLAFMSADEPVALPVTFDSTGARVITSGRERRGKLVVNLLWSPYWVASAGGGHLEVGADNWGRTTIALQGNEDVVSLEYRPPWKAGFAAGACLVAAGILLAAVGRRRVGNRPGV